MTLTFDMLRAANLRRLPLFKNKRGKPAHSQPDGSDWTVSDWFVATMGELGEAANQHKKIFRGDFEPHETTEEHTKLAHELADVVIYLDILAMRCGVSLGEVIAAKWNITSEKVGVGLRLNYYTNRIEGGDQ